MGCPFSKFLDPFKAAREKGPVHLAKFQGELMPTILRLRELRAAAKDWQTFSSDAPRRVPIPSEENVRTVRQYPLEVDPPVHGDYRKVVEPFFLRPKQPEVKARIDALIARLVDRALATSPVEVVSDFSIPLQSHALTYLLNVDEKEAETWISWGVHVFKDGDGESKGAFMEQYSEQKFRETMKKPGDDFFSALNEAEFQGRKLSMEEKLGYANIAFAGGRDTIIHTVTNIVAYFAENPGALVYLRENPDKVITAAEEFFRVFMPLTHIGRVCPRDTEVHGQPVKAGGRVSLCWSAANRDETMFEDADVVKLDRKPNPHISFGFGAHNCLGAHHARAIVRGLINVLVSNVSRIEILESEEHIEEDDSYRRKIGYHRLLARFEGR